MPRVARRRDPETTHHIICRSISEIRLFRGENDKIKYLQLMALYCKKFKCRILTYCLMDTHVHIQFDPQGCDLSKFMHGLNLCYAQFYNRKYKRHGHVFQGRFLSKVIDDDIYNLAVSAYIHANPKDIPSYKDSLHTYYFSSYGIYIGTTHDDFGLIDTDFILSQFANHPNDARVKYAEFVSECHQVSKLEKTYELIDNYCLKPDFSYESGRCNYPRDFKPNDIIEKVGSLLSMPNPTFIHIKYSRQTSHFRAIVVFLLRCLCDCTYKDICKMIGNITLSQAANLSNRGFELIYRKKQYQHLLPTFLNDEGILSLS